MKLATMVPRSDGFAGLACKFFFATRNLGEPGATSPPSNEAVWRELRRADAGLREGRRGTLLTRTRA